jgi:tRNA 2-thiouridine synthesizing protein A
MKHIDARGLSCPEPVIQARRAAADMRAGDQIEVLVDAGAARDNVLRAVRSLGCDAESVDSEGDFKILVTKK